MVFNVDLPFRVLSTLDGRGLPSPSPAADWFLYSGSFLFDVARASWQGTGMSQPQNQIVIYQPDETLRIDVRLENETVWLTQARMGELFGVDRSVINRHIRNIYATPELLEGATCAKIAQVQKEGGRMVSRIQPYYNLDVIIDVGYRVNSPQATHFRIWATGVLKEVLLRGYAVNERIDRGVHDRFLILDGRTVYHIGDSLKDLGKALFAFSRLEIPAGEILSRLR